MTRKVGPAGLKLIQGFESCARKLDNGTFAAYPDPGSSDGKPWTIGWGSTGKGIATGTIWTQEQCDERFAKDMQRYADEVSKFLKDAPTTQNQFDALVSFHYNTGAIAKSTLGRLHKAGNYAAAAKEFARWNRNDGEVCNGLTNRRAAERRLYVSGD